jgi:NAD-dependent dihydropyrimidine dehydrogenase PreA subunit
MKVETMKIKRKIIEIDENKCNGCGQCVAACAEGAIQIFDGKARLVSENYCDGLAACIGECPEGALSIVEREADAFDPDAVELHLKHEVTKAPQEKGVFPHFANNNSPSETLPCGCPSSNIQLFESLCEEANQPSRYTEKGSGLTHWPVQIKLVPPTAPFLEGADLLVASDCTPLAYPYFHNDFLKGKVVLIGCPKFDDTEEYIKRFAEIFRGSSIKSITVLIMEVPCCSKMPLIVRRGMELSGQKMPIEIITISVKGKILKRVTT